MTCAHLQAEPHLGLAGQRGRPAKKRTGLLGIGDDMGNMQLIELHDGDASSGILYVWPGSDAVCNIKPESSELAGTLWDEFWVQAKDGARNATRTNKLWEYLGKLVGGEDWLLTLGLTPDLFEKICGWATEF